MSVLTLRPHSSPGRRTGRVLVRIFGPLGLMLAIAAAFVEAGRWPAKRASLFVQTRRGSRTGETGAAVGTLGVCCSVVVVGMTGTVQFTVILKPLFGDA